MLSFRRVFDDLSIHAGLAVIFDMDGVLIRSTELHTRAWESYLARHGIAADGVLEKMLGKRNDQIVSLLFGEDLPAEAAAAHGAAKERLYRELMAPVLAEHIVEGAPAFIRALHARRTPLALATNAEPLNVDFVLDGAGLRSCFSALVDGHQVARPKPDPEVFLAAAARLRHDIRNCIIFEDSPGGMQAARAAGARVVGLLTTLEEAPLADLAIRDFLDPRLKPWLAAQKPL
jgi:HAD superfamily hydrolase (TIGR01509 family)